MNLEIWLNHWTELHQLCLLLIQHGNSFFTTNILVNGQNIVLAQTNIRFKNLIGFFFPQLLKVLQRRVYVRLMNLQGTIKDYGNNCTKKRLEKYIFDHKTSTLLCKIFSHAISAAILDRQDRMAFSLNSEAVYLITLRWAEVIWL